MGKAAIRSAKTARGAWKRLVFAASPLGQPVPDSQIVASVKIKTVGVEYPQPCSQK